MNSKLNEYIEKRIGEYDKIDNERKADLKQIADYISKKSSTEPVCFTFICTHNSRRSHFSQIWAQIAAHLNGLKNVKTFSGGTEASAFNLRAVQALRNVGVDIVPQDTTSNPIYLVTFAQDAKKITAFSKKYSDAFNPQEEFCAVMTCSDADEACPVVIGAEERISLTYIDPKKYDNTDQEEIKYAERCCQIAREMLFAFSLVGKYIFILQP